MDAVRSDIETLIQDLLDPDSYRSEQAQNILISLGTIAVDPLTQALSAESDRHRWKIINTLGRIGGKRVIPAMITCLNSRNKAIQGVAAQFLGQLGDECAVEPLLTALRENANGSSVWVIQALGLLADKRAVDLLIHIMQSTDSSAVRYTAVEALGYIGDKRATEAISAYSNDESHHVRSRVQQALERLNG